MFENRPFLKLSTLFFTLLFIAAILNTINSKKSEALDPGTGVAVVGFIKIGYEGICTHKGLKLNCKGLAKKTLKNAKIWLNNYGPKAIKYAKKKMKTLARRIKNKDRGFIGRSASVIIGSPSWVKNAISGIDLDDAQKEMLLPEYYSLVNSTRRNSKKIRRIQSKIHKLEMKLLRTSANDNYIIFGKDSDDIKEKLVSLSDEIDSLKNETAQK